MASAFFSCSGQESEKAEAASNTEKPLTDTVALVTSTDKVSYVLGANAGIGLRREEFTDVDINAFLKAVSAAVKNEATTMTKEAASVIVNGYIQNKSKSHHIM